MARETAGLPVIVKPPDEIDLNNRGEWAATLLDALDTPGVIIADMTGTTFCDSSGMRVLVEAQEHAKANGSTLRVACQPDGSVARSLALLGIDTVLSVYASVQDAMQYPA